jgi:hypothetical protein
MLISSVLVVASAAKLEVSTAGSDALWRRFQDLFGPSAGKSLLLLSDSDLDLFAIKHKRDEESFAAPMLVGGQAGQTIAAVNQLFDGKVQEGILSYRGRAPVHPQWASSGNG